MADAAHGPGPPLTGGAADESGVPEKQEAPRHDHAEGPKTWHILVMLLFLVAIVSSYEAYLGDIRASLFALAQEYGPRLFLAAGIIVTAFVLAGLLRVALGHAMPPGRRRRTLGALVRYPLYFAALLVALGALAPGQLSGLVVGLGLVGFGLTLALQTPILASVGWLTINAQGLYAVGDRIEVGEVRGDVMKVGLLTTVLWEIEGQLGRPTGHRVSFGNQLVLQQPVINYTADMPYNWNDIEVPVAKEGDWQLAEDILLRTADEVVGNERMARSVAEYERIMERQRLDYNLPRHPTVSMRLADDHSYFILRLRYLVHLDDQSRTRTTLLQRIYAEFGKHPRRLPLVYTRNQQMVLDRHGMPANAWGPTEQEPAREPGEPERVEAVPRREER